MTGLTKTSNLVLRIVIIASFVLSAVIIAQASGLAVSFLTDLTSKIGGNAADFDLTKMAAADVEALCSAFTGAAKDVSSVCNLGAILTLVLTVLLLVAEVLSWLAYKATGVVKSIGRGIVLLATFGVCYGARIMIAGGNQCIKFVNGEVSAVTADFAKDTVSKLVAENSGVTETVAAGFIGGVCFACAVALIYLIAFVLLILTITSVVNLVKSRGEKSAQF